MELAKFEGNVSDLAIVSNGSIKVLTINDTVRVPLFDSVPFWGRFVQPGSVKENKRLKGHVGEYYFAKFDATEDSDEEIDEDEVFSKNLRLLPIGFAGYTRALMPKWEPGSQDTTPICSSRDGIWPSANVELPICPKCGTWDTMKNGVHIVKDICSEGKWENGVKPQCKKTENWMFFDLDRKCPVVLPLAGVNIGSFRALNRKVSVLQLRAITKGEDLTQYFIKAGGEEGPDGSYYQMLFSFAKAADINPAEYLGAVAWYQDNVLPVLGTDPENPRDAAEMEAAGSMSEEDEAALELADAAAESDAADFEV